MATERSSFPFIRSVVFALLGAALAWQVLAHSLVAHLAEPSPETALRLRSDDPSALINIADRKLNLEHPSQETPAARPGGDTGNRIPSFARHARKATGSESEQGEPEGTQGRAKEPADTAERLPSNAGDPELRRQVSALAQTALAQDPMNARALRILGQVADAASEEAAASKLMQAAAQRSRRESVAIFWLMRESFEQKDFATAVQHADVLLRTRPQVAPQVTPTLARIAEHKDASSELRQMLATNPPWRASFFSTLMRNITDARTPLDLLLSLKDTPTPPTSAELREYLALLMRNQFHELAYYVWLQFLPQEQLASAGLLFNGDFESRPSGLPFDWVITAGSGVTIDLARRPDDAGQRALLVEFGHGRADFRGVAQYVMLAPGSYVLKGQYRGQLVGRRGLEWRINCAGAELPIAKTAMVTGVVPAWTEFSVAFTVPDADCRAQQVRLALDARSASEQLVTGSIWYDKLQIARAP
ncbi:MAG: hypothetical protein ABW200_17460 [Hyphomicrobiaceae bacterium]